MGIILSLDASNDLTTGEKNEDLLSCFRVFSFLGTFPFKLRDRETGTLWSLAGVALEGPLSGVRLQPLAGAYTAFWLAWAAFDSGTEVYEVP